MTHADYGSFRSPKGFSRAQRALIVFAKEPVPGKVKTRLKGRFSDEDRVRLYRAFVKDTLAVSRMIKNTRTILAFSSAKTPHILNSMADGFEMVKQKGDSLGERMYNALLYARERGSSQTVIIGTDSPSLGRRMIERAFQALTRKDVVIGPCVDGGYYLIGMKEPCEEIFQGVAWSTASVLKNTLDNTRLLKKTTMLLKEWYDVDDASGLKRLREDLRKSKDKDFAAHTKSFLENNPVL